MAAVKTRECKASFLRTSRTWINKHRTNHDIETQNFPQLFLFTAYK